MAEPWWPRDAVRNWELLMGNDAGLDPDRIAQELRAWDEAHEALTRSPRVLRMHLQLADELPLWLGDEGLRLLIAHDALLGRRGSAVETVISETAEMVRARLRRCTPKQARILAQHGYTSNCTYDEAVKWLAEINEQRR